MEANYVKAYLQRVVVFSPSILRIHIAISFRGGRDSRRMALNSFVGPRFSRNVRHPAFDGPSAIRSRMASERFIISPGHAEFGSVGVLVELAL
jgi:hypothetical protein